MSEESAGDLAIVLHSHMPYVEGFGTYPFGEEWLFDAVIRSYLPVLEVADRLTMTITPVLADQLEDAGVKERLRRVLIDWRIGAADADREQVALESRPACEAELARYRHALELLDAAAGDPLEPFRQAVSERRIALAPSAATHAVLPLLAPRPGLRLQLDAGIRSHRRRFGWEGGFWLPECAYAPGLEWRLAEHGVAWFCVDQSPHTEPLDALTPVATEAGPVALPIDWEAIEWLWSLDGYPSDPAHAPFAGQSLEGGRGPGGATRGGRGGPAPGRRVPRRGRREDAPLPPRARSPWPARLRDRHRAARPLVVGGGGLGGGGGGVVWLGEVLAGAAAAGVRLLTVPQALAEHEPLAGPLAASTWGEDKDLGTWDSPPVRRPPLGGGGAEAPRLPSGRLGMRSFRGRR